MNTIILNIFLAFLYSLSLERFECAGLHAVLDTFSEDGKIYILGTTLGNDKEDYRSVLYLLDNKTGCNRIAEFKKVYSRMFFGETLIYLVGRDGSFDTMRFGIMPRIVEEAKCPLNKESIIDDCIKEGEDMFLCISSDGNIYRSSFHDCNQPSCKRVYSLGNKIWLYSLIKYKENQFIISGLEENYKGKPLILKYDTTKNMVTDNLSNNPVLQQYVPRKIFSQKDGSILLIGIKRSDNCNGDTSVFKISKDNAVSKIAEIISEKDEKYVYFDSILFNDDTLYLFLIEMRDKSYSTINIKKLYNEKISDIIESNIIGWHRLIPFNEEYGILKCAEKMNCYFIITPK